MGIVEDMLVERIQPFARSSCINRSRVRFPCLKLDERSFYLALLADAILSIDSY